MGEVFRHPLCVVLVCGVCGVDGLDGLGLVFLVVFKARAVWHVEGEHDPLLLVSEYTDVRALDKEVRRSEPVASGDPNVLRGSRVQVWPEGASAMEEFHEFSPMFLKKARKGYRFALGPWLSSTLMTILKYMSWERRVYRVALSSVWSLPGWMWAVYVSSSLSSRCCSMMMIVLECASMTSPFACSVKTLSQLRWERQWAQA